MHKVFPTVVVSLFLVLVASGGSPAYSAETEELTNILKKVDGLVCTQPEKIASYYSPQLVIMIDDKRALLENRIRDYRQMIADYQGIQCHFKRQLLSGSVGKHLGYVLVDELISVTSDMTDTDQRQHSVCSYVFTNEGKDWKISLEHCSSLPDYTIDPGDDALYYFHNPVY